MALAELYAQHLGWYDYVQKTVALFDLRVKELNELDESQLSSVDLASKNKLGEVEAKIDELRSLKP